MNVELVAQMFKNYQSNVLFHLEGIPKQELSAGYVLTHIIATNNMKDPL